MQVPFTKCAMLLTVTFGIALSVPLQLWAHAGHKHEAEEPSIPIPEVVAIVNGKDILGSRVLTRLRTIIKKHIIQGQRPSPTQEKAEAKKLINEEIERELIRQKAEKLNITITKEMVADRINLVRGRFKSEDAFQKRLAKSGLTLDGYKQELLPSILMDILIEKEVGSKVFISTENAKSFYKKNKKSFWIEERARASVIMIKVTSSKDPKKVQIARKKIDKIYKKVLGGEDFAELAKKHSQDTLAKNGGDLGYFTAKKMLPAFSDRAFQLKPGSTTKPFLTNLGWHILKTTEKKSGEYKPFKDVEEKIRSEMKKNKTDEGAREYLNKLRKDATVKTYF